MYKKNESTGCYEQEAKDLQFNSSTGTWNDPNTGKASTEHAGQTGTGIASTINVKPGKFRYLGGEYPGRPLKYGYISTGINAGQWKYRRPDGFGESATTSVVTAQVSYTEPKNTKIYFAFYGENEGQPNQVGMVSTIIRGRSMTFPFNSWSMELNSTAGSSDLQSRLRNVLVLGNRQSPTGQIQFGPVLGNSSVFRTLGMEGEILTSQNHAANIIDLSRSINGENTVGAARRLFSYNRTSREIFEALIRRMNNPTVSP